MSLRLFGRTLALVAGMAMIASACGGGGGGAEPSGPSVAPTKGGKAVFGAEQWPQCLNTITSCNTSTWMQIVGPQPTLPKLVSLDIKGNPVPSPLITQVPSLDNGGITTNPFTVTYDLNPKAVWDDGSPITSADVEFTRKAILNTTGTTGPVGYDKIETIDTSQPTRVVLKFSEVYADWYDLFGGANTNGFVLKEAAFPKADKEKPDLKDEMNDLLPFSGGPWLMKSFSKSQEVLVRNPKFWGHQPLLDQVTFIPIEEQPQEIASLLSGQVAAIFPQASASSVLKQLAANPQAKAVTGPTNYGDSFWFQLDDPLMKDFAVRQALAYATNRQAIIDQIIKLNDPNATVLNCVPPLFPIIGKWCTPKVQQQTSIYSYNPQKAIQILETAGWDCSKVPQSPCTKGGQPLKITSYYTAGNTRREAVGALVQEGAKAAGIQFIPKPNEPTDLFSNKLPKGDYQSMEYASGATVDPSPTSFSWLCDQIPTKDNGYAGANYQHYCNKQLDPVMKQADLELDPARRLQLIEQVYTQIQHDLVALPLYPFINITAWRTDKIAGPVGQWNTAPYGTYWNMDEWFLPGGATA
ncbi:MAG TPA: ABC transporter substrate-binding protein [Actinomycetota bacterium]|jgi:peptide/nickel transport system substrate-binding protein